MAARRLLIIMVVLLTISTLAAALVPPPDENEESSTSTSSTSTSKEGTTDDAPKADDLIRAQIPVPRGDQRPREIEVAPGDQLALTVTSSESGEVSLPDFGLIEFAGPENPATFNVLIEEEGSFPIRFQGGGKVGTIVAEQAKTKPKAKPKPG